MQIFPLMGMKYFLFLNRIFFQERLSICVFLREQTLERMREFVVQYRDKERGGGQIPLDFTLLFVDYLSCVDVAA